MGKSIVDTLRSDLKDRCKIIELNCAVATFDSAVVQLLTGEMEYIIFAKINSELTKLELFGFKSYARDIGAMPIFAYIDERDRITYKNVKTGKKVCNF